MNTFFMDCSEDPRRWDVEINLGSVIKIQKTLAVDIMRALDVDAKGNLKTDVLDQLRTDPALLVDVLFLCCERQAAERGVNAENFGSLFVSGKMIEDATNALLQGILNIQPPKKKEIFTQILEMEERLKNSIFEEGEKILKDPTSRKMIEAEMKKVLSEPAKAEN